ncbi:hypothetical protein ACH436_20445 [Isoptericola sp. NPDC019693]|uniref:hypothetical protein n=1 Tax=Isoptericola sp. NPDC019693 TaxID=3364009 RepID=UPI00379C4CEC
MKIGKTACALGALVLVGSMTASLSATAESRAVSGQDDAVAFVLPDDAEPGIATDAPSDDDVYVDEDGNLLDPAASASGEEPSDSDGEISARAVGCTPKTYAQIPHVSKLSNEYAVHGKGSWKKGTCTASKARVTTCLYEWYHNQSNTEGYWERKDCVAPIVKQGGGKGRTAIVHIACKSTAATSWRTRVSVDVQGQVDTPETKTIQGEPNCRVP